MVLIGIGTQAAGEWVQLTTDSPEIQTGGTRGLIASGNTNSDKIEYANLATTGGVITFGNLTGTGGAYRVERQIEQEQYSLMHKIYR